LSAPAWLTARPIAHRGLHDPALGRIENSLGAARAAIARGFAIECDVQLSADGEAFVFHDSTLDRLAEASGAFAALGAEAIAATKLRGAGETIPAFAEFLAIVGGAVPLICEIKSHFTGDFHLAERVLALTASYSGPLAFKSFDPEVIAHLRARGTERPLGIVAEGGYDDPYFHEMSASQKRDAAAWLHYDRTHPDFLSWYVEDLPHAVPQLFRRLGGLPVMTWTVRTDAQRARAEAFADQIVFEGDVAA
jgi:glycerophosphoryl diester phosphodiesterase